MRLGEALQIIGQPPAREAGEEREQDVHLLCGFTPLLLETFVKAYLRQRFPENQVRVLTGLFGDLEGNIQRASQSQAQGAIVAIEWSDLDPRLGFRSSAGWQSATLDDIAVQVRDRCRRMESRLAELAEAMPVTVAAPALELPPLSYFRPEQASSFELEVNAALLELLRRICKRRGVRLVSASCLAMSSPQPDRHDVRMDLQAGYPYTVAHSDVLARLAVSCLFPAPPKKGLITDLDQTLWKGILGDSGVEGISWSLEDKSQGHALYQQLLSSLADSGVLLAIASKNDPALVDAALNRPDMLVQPARIFPVEAGWGVKSEAVRRILETWNIAADSVVFVDDSPMELAEVAEKYPEIECLPFPSNDAAAICSLITGLRARFGKEEVREEDRLRLQSIRGAAQFDREGPESASADFLARLEGKVTFETGGSDQRAWELVNKTNQFNLNGVRYTEAEWRAHVHRPGSFLATVSYEDRFGPLGRIAVMGGRLEGNSCLVDIWVMSCRAFSRQLEFLVLRELFNKSKVPGIRLRFKPTARNGPLQTFLGHYFSLDSLTEGELDLPATVFDAFCPPLFQQVIDKWTLSEINCPAAFR